MVPAVKTASWAGDPPHRNAARERLLAAARQCIARDGLKATGIAAVAKQAGVSRPTVYRYFRNRTELVQAALLGAGQAFAREVAHDVGRIQRPAEMAVESVLGIVVRIPDDPLLGEVWRSVSIDSDAARGFTGPLAIEMTRRSLAALVDAAGWDDAEADEACETIMRFVFSLLAAPEPHRSKAELRGYLMRRLVPSLGLA
ncbi:MAG: helix-turn-helix transcriptional regulator [Deltaproteobacteria bacterium]|nr:helix-turn-helix transcriptional regulator [Deltaproteobacteria bacterium]MBW2393357.1 helix-turn-helix transcriptional regulator [Deltaproteobacteria bacterium]